MPLTSTLA